MIITNVEGLRDPFMLLDDGVYYLYGTGVTNKDWDNTVWDCYVNKSGSLTENWQRVEQLIYKKPDDALKQFWAPEVHKYNGKYYMLSSYYSSTTNHRGSSVFCADSPVGPFTEISSGHITPHDKDCIDATLYIDDNGQPWLVFVHEWTCTDDNIGRMCTAKLSDDLTRLISQPVELFRADSPEWTNKNVTDGCFMYTMSDKSLIMLWSNFCNDGYCIGVAHSKNAKVDGEWVQESEPLYKRGIFDKYDGGHGMIFTDKDGKKYICCHSPNSPKEECKERTVLIEIEEQDNNLCIKSKTPR